MGQVLPDSPCYGSMYLLPLVFSLVHRCTGEHMYTHQRCTCSATFMSSLNPLAQQPVEHACLTKTLSTLEACSWSYHPRAALFHAALCCVYVCAVPAVPPLREGTYRSKDHSVHILIFVLCWLHRGQNTGLGDYLIWLTMADHILVNGQSGLTNSQQSIKYPKCLGMSESIQEGLCVT